MQVLRNFKVRFQEFIIFQYIVHKFVSFVLNEPTYLKYSGICWHQSSQNKEETQWTPLLFFLSFLIVNFPKEKAAHNLTKYLRISFLINHQKYTYLQKV